MIFYGNGSVWNPKNNSRLCRFIDGKCEVTDDNEIAFLVRAGYKHDAIDYGDENPVEAPVIDEEQADPVKYEPPAPVKKRGRKANASDQLDS